MRLSFRDMAAGGMVKNIPISSLVKVEPTSTLGSVKRKNQKRQIQLRSNVLMNEGYNPTAVNAVIAQYIENYKGISEGVTVKQTGENEQQLETVAFLGKALIIALMLILFTLVLQFNSISKSVIILTEILFSIIGVLLGFALTGMKVSGIMTGLGIVGLAGIVVKNGILVIEFADELRSRGYKTREAVIQAGKTRIIPVMLTALAAILGFIPIAIGFIISFNPSPFGVNIVGNIMLAPVPITIVLVIFLEHPKFSFFFHKIMGVDIAVGLANVFFLVYWKIVLIN
jgi:multidrug efflux pump subunit AcrB